MKVFMPTDSMEVSALAVAVYGPPGARKTSIAQTADAPLTLDFDRGIHRTKFRKAAVRFESWREVDEAMTPMFLKDYRTVVVDTVGRLLDLLTADIIGGNAKLGSRTGGLSQQGFGSLKSRFAHWMNQLRLLGKDVVLIAHEKEEKDGDQRLMRPDIIGGSYAEVLKSVDLCGYLRLSGGRHLLDFNPTDAYVGKNAAGWEPMTLPDLKERPTFFADILADAKKRIGQSSDESAAAARQVNEWRAKIDGFKEPDQFTQAVGALPTLDPAVRAQVRVLINDGAKLRQFTFDATNRAFVGKAVTA